MKIFYYIIIAFLSLQCISQTHKAIYSLKIEKNPITGSTDQRDEIGPLAENNEYYLYFDKGNAYYTSLNFENEAKDMSDALGGTYYPVKYNYKTKTLQFNAEFDKMYTVNDTNIPSWTITNETKQIAGYTCIKATGLYKDVTKTDKYFPIEAWFAPELAYPIGPKNFQNLPGLLVYGVFNNYQIYKLEKIKFNDNSVDIDAIIFEGEEINNEQYTAFLKQLLGSK